jgi:hypothetical protein
VSRALRNAACEYADRGWHVLPLLPGRKPPLGRLVPNGLTQATDDLATVFRWWKREPRANIGIVARPSGMLILDIDPRHGGDEELYELERDLGKLPETVSAETGGGGAHYLVKHPGGDFVGKLGEGVDVRDMAYIVAPPSIHPETRRAYAWDLGPDDVELAELSDRWLQRLRPRVGKRGVRVDLSVNLDHSDPLRRLPSDFYFARLAKRRVSRGGWAQCPFHKGGRERTPSLHLEGTVWACYACQPIGDRHVMGGNIYDLAALLDDYAIPLRGIDFVEVQRKLDQLFEVVR